MSQVRFGVADIAEIRFGISPLWETVASFWALARPGLHAVHLPWIKQARLLVRRRDLARHVAVIRAFARPGTWLPDFLTPPPQGPLDELDAQLALLMATPPQRVSADIREIARHRPVTPFATRVAEEPERLLPQLAAAVRAWFDAAIAPHWPRMRAVLEADIGYRARQLTDGGARLLFDTLHPAARWAEDRLLIADRWDIDVVVDGRGFPLVPSVFTDRQPLLTISAWAEPWTVYQARAVGTLWEGGPARGPAGSLARVLGRARAQLLDLTQAPATTTDLAVRTGLSPGAVSQHLAALHGAGLVSRNRQGREVYYATTELAAGLLRAADRH